MKKIKILFVFIIFCISFSTYADEIPTVFGDWFVIKSGNDYVAATGNKANKLWDTHSHSLRK